MFKKTICIDQVISVLDNLGLVYKRRDNHTINRYSFASIFNKIDNGFYFVSGDTYNHRFNQSLLLVSQNYYAFDERNNYIILEGNLDPQLVYYQILNEFFQQKATGTISKFSVINEQASIGKNTQIGNFSTIGKSIIGDNVIIGANVVIHDDTIIRDNVTIEAGSIIGAKGVAWSWNEQQTEKIIQPQIGGVEIKENCFLGAQTILVRGSINELTTINKNCLLAPGCRLGHGTNIGAYSHFANNVTTGGNTKIGEYCFVGSAAIFRPKVTIHPYTIVGAGALVIRNTTETNKTLMGIPAKEYETSENPSGMPKPKKINL